MRIINEDKLLLDIIDRGVDHIQTDDYAEICQIIAEQPTIQAVPIEVLQEMRKEIEHLTNANPSYWNKCDVVDREDTLEIIDTHISAWSGKEEK